MRFLRRASFGKRTRTSFDFCKLRVGVPISISFPDLPPIKTSTRYLYVFVFGINCFMSKKGLFAFIIAGISCEIKLSYESIWCLTKGYSNVLKYVSRIFLDIMVFGFEECAFVVETGFKTGFVTGFKTGFSASAI